MLLCDNVGPALLDSAVNEAQVGVEGRRHPLWDEEIKIKDNHFDVHVITVCTSGEAINYPLSL